MDHNILLQKIEYYGIRGITYDLLKSFLVNRNHFTTVNGIRVTKLAMWSSTRLYLGTPFI